MLDDRYIQRSRPHVGRQPRRLARSERMPLACHALESSWSALGLSNAARGLFSPCALAARTPMKSTFVASAAAGRRVARSFLGKHPRSTYPDPPTSLAPRKPPWLGRLEKRPSLFRSFHTSRRRHRRAPRPIYIWPRCSSVPPPLLRTSRWLLGSALPGRCRSMQPPCTTQRWQLASGDDLH
jgi:hypothetical protein